MLVTCPPEKMARTDEDGPRLGGVAGGNEKI
jgi:hypothetical protein